MGMCKWFIKEATKTQNGRQMSISNFLWAQKLSQKLFTFHYHIPHDMECAGDFFKVLLIFNMAAKDQLQKLKN